MSPSSSYISTLDTVWRENGLTPKLPDAGRVCDCKEDSANNDTDGKQLTIDEKIEADCLLPLGFEFRRVVFEKINSSLTVSSDSSDNHSDGANHSLRSPRPTAVLQFAPGRSSKRVPNRPLTEVYLERSPE